MKVNNNIIEEGTVEFTGHPKGLGWHIFERLKRGKDLIGQACCKTGVQDSYNDMFRRIIQVSIALKKYDLNSNDIIMLCSDNQFNDSVAWIASIFIGCKIITLDPNFSANDFNLLVKVVQPKLVFVVPEAEEKMEKALKVNNCSVLDIIVFGHTEKHTPFISLLKASDEEHNFTPVPCNDLHDTVIIVFSSGSSGLPKGICLSHYAILAQLSTELKGNFRIITFSTLYWISSIFILLNNIFTNSTRFIANKLSYNSFWHIIESQKINLVFLPPHLLLDLIDFGVPKNIDISSLKAIVVGGSPITADQIKYVKTKLPQILIGNGYGQTEISGVTCSHSHDTPEQVQAIFKKPDSVGKLKKGITAKIVNTETGEILGPNKVGELCLKSDYLFNGYHNQDSSDCFDDDGWFKTGDLMYYDNDKYFFHVDRVKEVFKFRGLHIQPVILESILINHPAVLSAIVIGKPHPRDGDWPLALVQLKKNHEHITEKELIEYFNNQVDDYKQLRGGLKFVPNFPLTVTGKIARNVLKNMYKDS